jgi:hypothetical protein
MAFFRCPLPTGRPTPFEFRLRQTFARPLVTFCCKKPPRFGEKQLSQSQSHVRRPKEKKSGHMSQKSSHHGGGLRGRGVIRTKTNQRTTAFSVCSAERGSAAALPRAPADDAHHQSKQPPPPPTHMAKSKPTQPAPRLQPPQRW